MRNVKHSNPVYVLVVLLAWIAPTYESFAADPAVQPVFTAKPEGIKVGNGAKITFAVSAPTDVAVYVENAKRHIVRHLAAGRLGKNPPDPLKADSLAQTLEWDGLDDDGLPAGEGPFQVRVGLGLKATWGGVSFVEPGKDGPNRIERIMGLACGPNGKLYVLDGCDAWVFKNGSRVLVLRRDGSYEKTIKPFPPTLSLDRVKGIGAFVNSFGAINPVIYSPHGLSFYPQQEIAHQPVVTADGHLVLAGQLSDPRPQTAIPTLAMIDGDGGLPNSTYAGSELAKALWKSPYPSLTTASEGGAVYLTGLGSPDRQIKAGAWPAVYRVKMPERCPAELFFGDPDKAGNDNAHLNDPRGLATDGKGHLLIADFGNNRVVVLNEKEKSLAGSFPVEQPTWVAVHPKTGAVYVCSKQTIVVKYSSWNDPKEQARVDLSPFFSGVLKKVQGAYHWGSSLCFALDGSAEPAVLWIGLVTNMDAARQAAGAQLLVRCEDQGSRFSDAVPSSCGSALLLRRPAADPTRREVACLREGRLHILNEETGKIRVVGDGGRGSVGAGQGRNPRLDRDGKIYCVDHEAGLIRYSADGKPQPFQASANLPYLQGRLPAGATGTTWWEGGFYVDRKGDIYVRKDGLKYHGQKCIQVYDREGNFKRTAIWALSDAGYGPRTDARGNIYIMDIAKPTGQPFPTELNGQVVPNPDAKDEYFGPSEPSRPTASVYNWMYGSIVKFGPEGGATWMGAAQGGPNQLDYEGWRGIAMELRTTGGALTGGMNANPQYPTWLVFPTLNLDASKQNKITLRLKNATEGNQATLGYSVNWHPHSACDASLGRFSKVIEIKPNSDFTEYTFDMSAEKEWKDKIHWLTLIPSNGKKGAFSIDWVRIDGADTLAWNFDHEDAPDRKLPTAMKKERAIADHCPEGIELQGALWMRPGFSPTYAPSGGTERCRCTGTEFDVDDFGRVFAPDLGRFRVGVLDANGNDILSFGAYGNQDFCGPDSYVLDSASKLLRPRKDSDPKELVSPFAQPEIAFAWIMGLAVTDRYTYVADAINKRILRVNLGYSAEGVCVIK